MEEGIHCMVPMLVIPFLGDQYANGNRMEKLNVALQLELTEMTEETLRNAINASLNPELKKNIQKLRELVYDEPMPSLEKAVWWIEYVARNGAKHLQFNGKNVPIHERYCLDIVALAICLIYISWKALQKCFRCILKRNKSKKE